MRDLLGENDRHLKTVESSLGVEIYPKGNRLLIRGKREAVELSRRLFAHLAKTAKGGQPVQSFDVDLAIRALRENPDAPVGKTVGAHAPTPSPGKSAVVARTKNQQKLVDAVAEHDIVFVWGPAGTGKTYLSMALAVSALLKKEVDRIILTRPAVEAGEKLGFLPGDLEEKINPYLRPLFDALHEMVDPERAANLLAKGVIEMAPLAFMRGRTLSRSFVILDEAQNTTPEQMKMFLTRIGFDSKAVVTGDVTQIDLPLGKSSGLIQALDVLRHIRDIGFVELESPDIVRHPIVQQIVDAYDDAET